MDLASMGAGIASAAGAIWQQERSGQLAAQDREWRTDQQRHAYSYTVADLKDAGLNPMLAYSRGPTAAPGGGPTGGIGENAGAAFMNSAMRRAELGKVEAETKNIEADTLVKLKQPAWYEQQTATGAAQQWQLIAQRNNLVVEYNRLLHEVDSAKHEKDRRQFYNIHIQPIEAAIANIDYDLKNLQLPEARSAARYYSGPGGTYRPYLHDIGSLTGAAASATGAAAAGRFLGRGIEPNRTTRGR